MKLGIGRFNAVASGIGVGDGDTEDKLRDHDKWQQKRGGLFLPTGQCRQAQSKRHARSGGHTQDGECPGSREERLTAKHRPGKPQCDEVQQRLKDGHDDRNQKFGQQILGDG